MDELQPAVGLAGEHPHPAQRLDGLAGLGGALPADPAGQVLLDLGAEQGGGPGELQDGGAELVQPVVAALAAGRGGQVAQPGRVLLDRFEVLVADLAQQRHRVVRAAGGDRPDLAAERVVGLGELAVHDGGHRHRVERQQLVLAGGPFVDLLGQRPGLLLELVPVGEDQQHGQLPGPHREGRQPGQRLLVDGVQVVDDHHQRGAPGRELGDDEVQAVADALRVDPLDLVGRRGQSDGRGDDVVPAAEDLLDLGLGQVAEHRQEQLAQHPERLPALPLVAAGEQHGRVLAGAGDPADLFQHGGLADAGRSGEDQQFADPQTAGGEFPAQPVHGLIDGTQFLIALPQPLADRLRAGLPLLRPVLLFGHVRPSDSPSGTPFPTLAPSRAARAAFVQAGAPDAGLEGVARGKCLTSHDI
nr:hypothetical protein [Kitasatospora sp. NRRL B-11411]